MKVESQKFAEYGTRTVRTFDTVQYQRAQSARAVHFVMEAFADQAAIGQPRQLRCKAIQLSCTNLQPCKYSIKRLLNSGDN